MLLPDDTKQMLEDCEARESRLSDWERGFIDSLSKSLAAGRGVTERQYDRLVAIWAGATSDG